ncbi:MAG: hypothetical protein NTV00_13740, partial [Methylococcales bacterium]|nr:hypothetical protein [Methylococcales bacterium]
MNKTKFAVLLTASVISLSAPAADDKVQELEEMVVIGSAGIKHSSAKSAKPVTVLSDDKLHTN